MIYTKQSAFNRIWNFFAVQKNGIAKQGNGCKYTPIPESGNNCGCAIGCLLNKKEQKAMQNVDSEISVSVRCVSPDSIWFSKIPQSVVKKLSGEHTSFWEELQMAHDGSDTTDEFVERLKNLADGHNLTIPA